MKNKLMTKTMFFALILGAACQQNGENEKSKNCKEQFPNIEKWTLITAENSMSKFGPFPKTGYLNAQGDTVIPIDTYRCLSDTFEYYGLIQDIRGDGKMYGIDKTGKKLFEAVHDGEGYACIEYDGRIMIQQNGKYGYTNHKGEIVIKAQYRCAENFYRGIARVSNQCEESRDEHDNPRMSDVIAVNSQKEAFKNIQNIEWRLSTKVEDFERDLKELTT